MNTSSTTARRVRFDDSNTTYHDAPAPLTPEECQAAFFTVESCKANLQDDIRATIKGYLKSKKAKFAARADKDEAYGRGLDLLDPEEQYRQVRCRLYRKMVLRQQETLRSSMTANHASELLEKFATEKSKWARERAAALAADDAAQARKVYREAYQSKEGADQGLWILPSGQAKRSMGGSMRRKSGLARTA